METYTGVGRRPMDHGKIKFMDKDYAQEALRAQRELGGK